MSMMSVTVAIGLLLIGVIGIVGVLVARAFKRAGQNIQSGLGTLGGGPKLSEDDQLTDEQRRLMGFWLGDCYHGAPKGLVQKVNALEIYQDATSDSPQWFVRVVPRDGGIMQTVSSKQYVDDPNLIAFKVWTGKRPVGLVHRLSMADMLSGG